MQFSSPRRTRWAVRIALCLGTCLLLSSCGALRSSSPGPQPAADALVRALHTGRFDDVPAAEPVTLAADYVEIVDSLGPIKPAVTLGDIASEGESATARLHYEWRMGDAAWNYETTAHFRRVNDQWQVAWAPSVVHPDLTAETRLLRVPIAAKRAKILGQGGSELMTQRDVVVLGLDKPQLKGGDVAASVKRLAQLLKIDEANYAKKVAAYGDAAFVDALVIRGTAANVPVGFASIPGARAVPNTRILAPTPTFASGMLGSVGEADAAAVAEAKGEIVKGQIVGKSGLQKRHDKQLRGTPGAKVMLAAREGESESAGQRELFRADPVEGEPLKLTLNEQLQLKAEKVLAGANQVVSLVAIDPKTGAIRAAANSSKSGQNQFATTGRYPPGSTFKVVTSLALSRQGLTPGSRLRCDPTTVVDGRQFKNYSDFPASGLGSTTLAGALANSCNTAFISMHGRLTPTELSQAAQSLGMGTDHDAGFPVFYGSVPPPKNEVGKAESLIGQGLVEASPLAMAGVTASVAGGKTTVPYLVETNRSQQPGKPLTAREAQQLRALMSAVVANGSGRGLQGTAKGAKTGTAEYFAGGTVRTHAWMMAYTDSLAVAVFVHDGKSGSADAGPVVKAFLN